ncbi:MAG: CBS domain-containing protein [Nitrososphaera sp.]|uniref:CBS domain-containing protein n=1 Tax=Nitrososphaera sp. TaxID=1971748 RepID=UPI00185C8FB2|nr:CBS domain-containing protein [Nitrososphaera sp.]NWG37734.1 CBS domain-containing protein [Nitrososphaera sp.]
MSTDKTAQVQKIMTALPLQTAPPTASVKEIAEQMNAHKKGAIVIVDAQNRPLGIITERDIVRRVVAEGRDPVRVTALDVMSHPVISVDPDVSIYNAALVMTKYKIRRLPAVRDNVLHGIVTATDLARYLYEKNKQDPTLQAMSRFSLIEHA